MKINKLLISFVFIFLLVLSSSFSNATIDLQDGLVSYWKFDESSGITAFDSHGSNDGTINDATINQTGKINTAYYFDGVNSEVEIGDGSLLGNAKTVSLWFKTSDTSSGNKVLMGQGMNTGDTYGVLAFRAGTGIRILGESGTTQNFGGASLNDGEWHHLVATNDGTETNIYVDGAFLGSGTNWFETSIVEISEIGAHKFNGNYVSLFKGKIDEPAIWDRVLNSDEIEALYNNGDGNQYPFKTETNFTITAKNVLNNESITNFTATINGTTYNDVDGKITTEIPLNTTKSNFTIEIEHNEYFTKTLINQSVSSALEVSLYPAYTYLNVTATSYSSEEIYNFTARAVSYNSTYNIEESTTESSLILKLKWNETFEVTIDATGYALYQNSNNVTMVNYTQNLTIENLYKTNTVHINFKDEENNNPLTQVNLYLISDVYAGNYSSGTDSNITIEMLNPLIYEAIFNKEGYLQRTFTFEVTDRSYNNLTFYLLESTSGEPITATVFDSVGKEVERAKIEVLKYDFSLNSYKLVSQSFTNWQGISVLNLFKNDVYYKFRISYNNHLKLTTSPTFIFRDTLSFQINTELETIDIFKQKQNINYELLYNSETNNVRFEYSDPTGTVVQNACLKIFRTIGSTTTDYDESCIISSSGTILIPIEIINNTYYTAKGYVTISDEEIFIDTLYINMPQETIDKNVGLFLIILLTITFAFMGLWNPVIAIILTPIPLIFGSIIGFVAIPISTLIFFQVIAFILAMVVGKRS